MGLLLPLPRLVYHFCILIVDLPVFAIALRCRGFAFPFFSCIYKVKCINRDLYISPHSFGCYSINPLESKERYQIELKHETLSIH